jgi:hypothetical protein
MTSELKLSQKTEAPNEEKVEDFLEKWAQLPHEEKVNEFLEKWTHGPYDEYFTGMVLLMEGVPVRFPNFIPVRRGRGRGLGQHVSESDS